MQQPVGVLTVLAGTEVISALNVVGVDFAPGHELLQLDAAGLLPGGRIDLVLAEQDVFVPADLVPLSDLLVGHLLALLGADPLLLDARPVCLVNLMKVDALVLDRGMNLDGDRDQPKADGAVPDRAGHRGNALPGGRHHATEAPREPESHRFT